MRIQRLVEGIHHFQRDIFAPDRNFFENLAHEQRPEALFITCADSRINPNLVTQTAPGELFVVRNVGNLVPGSTSGPTAEAAAIEFAVKNLGIHDIIICGHTHCGAIQALLDETSTETLPATLAWLQHADQTRKILRESYGHLNGEELARAAVQENVLVQLEQLRTHPVVAEGLAEGTMHLHGWVYHLASGLVTAFNPAEGQFKPIAEGVSIGDAPMLGP